MSRKKTKTDLALNVTQRKTYVH